VRRSYKEVSGGEWNCYPLAGSAIGRIILFLAVLLMLLLSSPSSSSPLLLLSLLLLNTTPPPPPSFPPVKVHGMATERVMEYLQDPHDALDEAFIRYLTYGDNQLDVNAQPFPLLVMQEALKPFFAFQVGGLGGSSRWW